jgi:hypothetical protein
VLVSPIWILRFSHRPRKIFTSGIDRSWKKKIAAPFLSPSSQGTADGGGAVISAGITEVEYGIMYSYLRFTLGIIKDGQGH